MFIVTFCLIFIYIICSNFEIPCNQWWSSDNMFHKYLYICLVFFSFLNSHYQPISESGFISRDKIGVFLGHYLFLSGMCRNRLSRFPAAARLLSESISAQSAPGLISHQYHSRVFAPLLNGDFSFFIICIL